MPCYDGSNGRGCDGSCNQNELKRERDQRKKLEAMLCATWTMLHKIGRDYNIDNIDWKEAGVTKAEFDAWWKLHQEEDRKRKLKEQQAARTRRITQDALNKLTDEEKKLLGLK